MGVIVVSVRRTYSVESDLRFEIVEQPAIGMVRVLQDVGDSQEFLHLARNREAAERRLANNRCSRAYLEEVPVDAVGADDITPTLVATMLRNLGIDHVPTLAPEDDWAGFLDGRIGLQLADGLVVRRSHVMNDWRVELIGFTDAMVPRLKALDLISEIISWKLRLFIPTDGQGYAMLASLLERHTMVGITERTTAA